MTARAFWIAVTAVAAWLTLTSSVNARSLLDGLRPGQATRPEVERALGKPLRSEFPNAFEYRLAASATKFFVQYRENSAVVERIEAIFPERTARAAALASLGLNGPPDRIGRNVFGKMEEYYARSGIVLTYRDGDAASGVHRASYFDGPAFKAAMAHANTNTQALTGPANTHAANEDEAPRVVSLNFDGVSVGSLDLTAFEDKGVKFVKGDGTPGIYAQGQTMVLPGGRSNVLLVAGDRTTSLMMTFDRPVRRVSMARIGVKDGASVPTWTMQAFDRTGNVVATTGEEHGLPPQPQSFSVKGDGIVLVVLSTDNRFGDGTWATWNSLPVAEFEIER